MTVNEMLATLEWKPIPNCPGRYVLVKPERSLAPEQLAQVSHSPLKFRVEGARDAVWVLFLEGGGLISYQHQDGSYHHTLNTEAGLRRKLAQLGIDRPGPDPIW